MVNLTAADVVRIREASLSTFKEDQEFLLSRWAEIGRLCDFYLEPCPSCGYYPVGESHLHPTPDDNATICYMLDIAAQDSKMGTPMLYRLAASRIKALAKRVRELEELEEDRAYEQRTKD